MNKSTFKKIGWFYNHLEEYLLVVLLLTTVVLGFTQVIMRYVFNNSLTWSEELARIIFIWMSWLGISYGQKKNEHIKVNMFVDRLKRNAKKIVLIIAYLCTMAILVVFAIEGVVVVDAVMSIGSHTPALSIPKWCIYASVPISCALMVIRVIKEMVLFLKNTPIKEVK